LSTGTSSALPTDMSSALSTGTSSALPTDMSSALSTGTSSALPTDTSSGAVTDTEPGALSLTSSVLTGSSTCSASTPESCSVFLPENTSYLGNANLSPPLAWSGVPPGTASFALRFSDVSFGQTHWAIWNIPASVT